MLKGLRFMLILGKFPVTKWVYLIMLVDKSAKLAVIVGMNCIFSHNCVLKEQQYSVIR